jgi:hypothetical protein
MGLFERKVRSAITPPHVPTELERKAASQARVMREEQEVQGDFSRREYYMRNGKVPDMLATLNKVVANGRGNITTDHIRYTGYRAGDEENGNGIGEYIPSGAVKKSLTWQEGDKKYQLSVRSGNGDRVTLTELNSDKVVGDEFIDGVSKDEVERKILMVLKEKTKK